MGSDLRTHLKQGSVPSSRENWREGKSEFILDSYQDVAKKIAYKVTYSCLYSKNDFPSFAVL